MPPRSVLPFLNHIRDAWTPLRAARPDGPPLPLVSGLAFVPAGQLGGAIYGAASAGLPDVRAVIFNGAAMLVEDAALDGLREAEAAANAPSVLEPPCRPGWLRVGADVRVVGGVGEGLSGKIKRLDAEYAHIEAPGSVGRIVCALALLRPAKAKAG